MIITANASFGLDDLTIERGPHGCPVIGCKNESIKHRAEGSRKEFYFCEEHGLKIHNRTFVYYNGDSPEDRRKARLRNFLPHGRDFVDKHILGNPAKAESHRLGAENSEDALTWNIFGELHRRGQLHLVYNLLTGETATSGQVTLFLWGLKIDFDAGKAEFWQQLKDIRDELEKGIKRFHTEPDIILLGPSKLIVIEAKFTSGNPVCVEGADADDEKPKSRLGLIQRYIENNKLWRSPVLCGRDVGEKVHSQLLRMIVFGGTLAQMSNLDWKIVNLVSRTQWNQGRPRKTKGYDFENPTAFIPEKVRDRFRFLYWEELYDLILSKESHLEEVANYMQKKTANLSKAFRLERSSSCG